MPIVATDIQFRLSGGAANSDPLLSLGGAKSSVVAGTNLLDDVLASESSAGDTEYRCLYVHNNHGSLTLQTARVWIVANTASASTDILVGVGSAAAGGTEQTVADAHTSPTSVTFSNTCVSFGTSLLVGDISAGSHKALWLKRIVNASAAASNDTFTLRVQGDTAA